MITAERLLSLASSTEIVRELNTPSLTDEELATCLEMGADLVQQDAATAATTLAETVKAATARNLLDLAAEASYLEARATLIQGKLEPALVLIDQAADLWLKSGDPIKAARTGLGRMNVLDDLGRHREAIDVGENLIRQLDALVPDAESEEVVWMRAAALENVGVGRGYLGQHEAALDAYRQAEEVYRANGLHDEVARPMANRGVELVELGQLSQAIAALRGAALDFDRQGDNLFAAKCLAYEARAQMLRGNYVASAAAVDRAAQYLEGQDATTEYARTQLVRAETLTSMNLLDESLATIDALIGQLATAGLEHDLAAAYFGRAVAQAKHDDSAAAAASYAEAEERYGAVGDNPMAAVARLGRSELCDAAEALDLTSSALETLVVSGRPADHAAAELRMSQLMDDPQDAIEHLDLVAAILTEHDLPHLRWKELAERGRRLREVGKIGGARNALVAAMAGLDEMRRTVDQDLQRLPFMGGRDQVHQELVNVLLDQGNEVGAYAVSERARARTLVERIRGELAAVALDPATAELDALYSELLLAPGLAAKSIRSQARPMEATSGSVVTHETTSPADLGPIPTVTYQTLGDEVMAFVSIGDQLRVSRHLASTSEVAGLLERLDVQWRRFGDPSLAARQQSHLMATTLDLLQRLHLSLLGPLDILNSDSLMIVPWGILTNVPFGALHDGTCHLVERMPVTVAPSRTVAEHAAGRLRGATHRLVMGVADEHTPHVDDEIRAIAAVAPGSTLLEGDAATTDAFWLQAPDHDIIHVASHGIERPDNPLFGAIRFADRWLTAAEIAGSSLDGQLVILSGCSTGRQHRAGSGDEVIGLPRALLAAGASAVVVNLWPVADIAASMLMAPFHQNLEELSPPEALRAAKIQLMSANAHPYWWAPSVVIGAPVQPKENS